MNPSECGRRAPPRFWIERGPVGYRVLGAGFEDWEPTFAEATAWREELEYEFASFLSAKPDYASLTYVAAFESGCTSSKCSGLEML